MDNINIFTLFFFCSCLKATPQLLYQRPYDPVVLPVQNQQIAVGNPPVLALSQPSYAPSRILPAASGLQQQQGPAMFRHALLRVRLNK